MCPGTSPLLGRVGRQSARDWVGRSGKELSPTGPFLPLSTNTAHLQELPFWEQDMKMSCQAFSPAGISIVCAVVLLHKLFLADRESGWNFSELHLLPASTAGLLSPLLGATLHHGSLCIRCTHTAGPLPQQAAAVTQTPGNSSRKILHTWSTGLVE